MSTTSKIVMQPSSKALVSYSCSVALFAALIASHPRLRKKLRRVGIKNVKDFISCCLLLNLICYSLKNTPLLGGIAQELIALRIILSVKVAYSMHILAIYFYDHFVSKILYVLILLLNATAPNFIDAVKNGILVMVNGIAFVWYSSLKNFQVVVLAYNYKFILFILIDVFYEVLILLTYIVEIAAILALLCITGTLPELSLQKKIWQKFFYY